MKEFLHNIYYVIPLTNNTMSKVHKVPMNETQNAPVMETTSAPAEAQEASKQEFVASDITAEDGGAGSTHTRRIVVEANLNSDQLEEGTAVKIKNAVDIFKPSFDVSELSDEDQASMNKLDFRKGIVTSIKMKSIYSNCPEGVTLSLNLFTNRPQITNTEGWLFTETKTDFGTAHTQGTDGFTNLVNVLPYERARADSQVYTPENILNNRFIEQYGGYTLDKLWEGIVPFPKQDYFYVEANHIILKVIQRNWEMLGINCETEKRRENQYVKVSKTVVNNVIKQLYEQVISQIPYTSFDNLQAKFHSKEVPEGNYKVMCELLVEYKYPAINKEAEAEQE